MNPAGATLTIATRKSPLALAQVDEVRPALLSAWPPGATLIIQAQETPGDRDLVTALTDPAVPQDFFTRDLDRALLEGRADLAVHSAKDLPQTPVPGLSVVALLPARDIREALVVRRGLAESAVRTIGTSSPRRETELRKLMPNATLVPLRGTIQQRLAKLDAGDYDALVMAACALERLGLAERITSYLPFEPTPQQGRLALVVRADRHDLIARLRALDIRRHAGLVALVGCPADATLLARRAVTYLREADVILHDRLIPDEVLTGLKARLIPVGKTGGGPSTPQLDIHRTLLHEAEKGHLVVRLHGGDPGIYGHLGEEAQFLTDWNIRCDVVPAVTAAQIAAARARAPLTHRGSGHRVTLVTAKPGVGYDDAPMPGPDVGNLAIYMGVQSADRVQAKLHAAGWSDSTPVVVGERLGYSDEQIRHVTAGDLATLTMDTPSVFLVGVRTFPSQQFTLFTGTDPDHFLRHGPLLHWPMIELASIPLDERRARLAAELPRCDGLLFPSRFAVHSFMETLLAGGDTRDLGGKKLLAVGPATENELRTYGLRADGSADNLGGVRALARKLGPPFTGRYLYPCSDASPQADRIAGLREHGIELAPVVFYENRETAPRDLPRLPFDRVLFTSTTTVQAYFRRYPLERERKRTWLAVGPSTLKALEDLHVEAESLREGIVPV